MVGIAALAKVAINKFMGGGGEGGGVAGGIMGLWDKRQDRKQFELEFEANVTEMLIDFGATVAAGQMEVNKVEAANPSLFVSGWRPAIGWICGVGLAYNFLIYHIIAWAWAYFKVQGDAPPNLDTAQLYPLLMGMLGLGGMRSLEKYHGVARKR